MKKNHILLFLPLIMCVMLGHLAAVPANPKPIEKTQPDGTKITIRLKGDERIHWIESLDGYTLMYNNKQEVVFAVLDKDGNLTPSKIVYKGENLSKYSALKRKQIQKIPVKLRYSEKQIKTMRQIRKVVDDAEKDAEEKNIEKKNGTMRKSPSKAQAAVTGTHKVLVILAEFADKPFKKTKAEFEALMNQEGYTANGNTGSVKDFYRENSYGKMNLEITVVGPVKLSKNLSYYADISGGGMCHIDFPKEVATLADPLVNFADFAVSSMPLGSYTVSNAVPNFHIIFASYGDEACGGEGNYIWSHKYSFVTESRYYDPKTLDGVKVGYGYSCSPELEDCSGTNLTYVGVICHELGHAFGAPDYYDTDYDEGTNEYGGNGKWDLMSSGNWNNYGATPAHINMWQKINFGWVTPVELTSASSVANMPAASESAVAYWIKANTNGERYVLENRQKKKFDAYIPGHGLIIYHVHKDALGGDNDNTTSPQQVYPVCANSSTAIPNMTVSSYGTINGGGCPFPGTGNKKSFGGTTTPQMFSWGSSGVSGTTVVTGKDITNITENTSTNTISFDFMGGGTTPPDPDPDPVCDSIKSLPFVESFENTDYCWSTVEAEPDANLIGTTDAFSHEDDKFTFDFIPRTGDNFFMFSSYYEAEDYNQYLITPQITLPYSKKLAVKFYYRKAVNTGYGVEVFRVGYSSIGKNIADFTWHTQVSASSATWREYSDTVPAGTKYIAINYMSEYVDFLTIDDFSIDTVASGGTTPPDPVEDNYVLVTSAADLVLGAKYIIAGKTSEDVWYGLGSQNSNNRKGISLGKTSSAVPAGFNITAATSVSDQTKVYEITLGGTAGAYTLYDNVGSKYLTSISGSNNYLKLNSSPVNFTIGVTGAGVATVKSTLGHARNRIMFNESSTLFSCYASGQQDIYLYKSTEPVIPPKTNKVTFSLSSGTYYTAQNLTLSCATAGSRIFYTTDGITSPIDTNNPAVKRYTSALSISTNTTVKAVAFSKGYVTLEDSVATAVYAIKIRKITLTAPAESQQFTGNSVNVGWTTENFIAGTDGKFKVSVTGRPDVVTTETSYMITNLVTGSYSVTVALTDMSGNLFSPNVSGTRNFTVDLPNVGSPVISSAGGEYNDSAVVHISCETAGATIFVSTGGVYTEYSGQIVLRKSATVAAYAVKAGMDSSAVVSETYTIIPTHVYDTVKTPVISPVGGKYNDSVVITVTCETAGATIFVSTGGAYTEYSGQRVLRENAVVSAYAMKEGEISEFASRRYTIIPTPVRDTVKTPVISPAGGEYNDSAVVSISCETAGATIFVSTGGAYTEYNGEMVLRENTVVSAYAVKADMDTSAVASETYTIIRLGVSDETLVGTGVAVDVYPNPTNGKFNVVVAVPALIEIFSQSGVCVEKKHVSEKAEFVLMSKGLYLLRATDAKGNVSTKKIIVK